MGFHVAAVVQAGQRVEDRHFDRVLHVVAQMIGIAPPADLGARPRQQFVLVDRAQQIVVDADLEPAQQPRIVVGIGRSRGSATGGCAPASAPGCTAASRRNSPGSARRSADRNCPRRRETAPPPDWVRRRRCARRTGSAPAARRTTAGRRPAGCARRRPCRRSALRSGASMPISSEVMARMRSSSVIIFSRVSERTRAISTTSDDGLGEEIIGAGFQAARRDRTGCPAR